MSSDLPRVQIYTDGSCSQIPEGGLAAGAVIVDAVLQARALPGQ